MRTRRGRRNAGIILIAVGIAACVCAAGYWGYTTWQSSKAKNSAASPAATEEHEQAEAAPETSDPETTEASAGNTAPEEPVPDNRTYEMREVDPRSAAAKYNPAFERSMNRMITVVLHTERTVEELKALLPEDKTIEIDDRSAELGVYYLIFSEDQPDAYLDTMTASLQCEEIVMDCYRDPYVLEGQDLTMEFAVEDN